MSTWAFLILPAACLLIALMELDGVLIGQWMFSRPLVTGPIIGGFLGDPVSGLAMGTLFEMITLDGLPVGGTMSLNATVAAGGATILAAGPHVVPLPMAFPVGLGLGAGYQWIEARLRRWRVVFSTDSAATLRRGGRIDWETVILKSVFAQAAATFLFLYVSVGIIGPWFRLLWDAGPELMRSGLGRSFGWMPWIGYAVLLHALGRRG